MATSIARLAIDLVVNSNGLKKEFTKALRPMQKFGSQMTAIGKDMSMKITAPVAAMGVGILKAAGDFEAGMNRVQAITGATSDQFIDLRNQAKELGATTQFSATEAASGIEMLAKNGLKYQEITEGALEATLKLSAATGSDLSRAADIATDAMLAFGVQAKDMESAVNAITGVTLNSKFDIEGYAYALANAGGVASSVGVEFDDFNATIAAIAPSFSSGMTAGTAFKTFMARMKPTSKPAIEAMGALKLSFFNAQGQMDDMATVAAKLQKAFGGLSEEDKLAKGIQIFGTEGVRAAFAIMNAGADDINRLKGALADTSAADQATARMKGLNGAMLKLKSALEAVAIAIADSGLLEWVTESVERLTEFTSSLSKTNPEMLKWGTVIAGAAAALGPLILGLGTLATALAPVAALIAAKGGLIASMVALANPVTGVVVAMTALTAAYLKNKETVDAFLTSTFLAMFQAWDSLKAKLSESLDAFLSWASGWQESLQGWDTAMMAAFAKVGGYILDAGDYFTNLLDIGGRTFKQIGLFVEQMVARVQNWLADKLVKITEKAGGAVDSLKEKFRKMADAVVFNSYVPDMVDLLGDEFTRMKNIFIQPSINSLQQMQDEFQKTETIAKGIKLGPVAAPDSDKGFKIGSLGSIGPDQFKLPTSKADKSVKDFSKVISDTLNRESDQSIDQLVRKYERIGEGIGGAIVGIGDGVENAESLFDNFGKNILSKFKDALGGITKEANGFDVGGMFGLDSIGNIFSGGKSGIGSIGNIFSGGGGIMDAISGIFSGGGAGGGMFGSILGGIGSLFGGFFANGGDPPVGKISMVGENGPELIMPKTATTVIPNHALGSVSGSGRTVNVVVNQNNNFEGGVTVPQVGSMLKEHGSNLVKSITDNIQRGGAFRQAFQG